MPFDDASATAEREAPRREEGDLGGYSGDSLILELRGAAGAAVSQVRKVAATASTEARISVASIIWMVSAMLVIVALLIVAWSCLVGIGIWFAIDAGWSVAAALFAAAAANIAAALLCRTWFMRLSRNIGFTRTLSLLLGSADKRHEHPR